MLSSRITRAASLKATAEVSNEGAEVALGARVGVCDGAVEGAPLGALLRVVVGATVVGGAVRGLAVGVVVKAIAGRQKYCESYVQCDAALQSLLPRVSHRAREGYTEMGTGTEDGTGWLARHCESQMQYHRASQSTRLIRLSHRAGGATLGLSLNEIEDGEGAT